MGGIVKGDDDLLLTSVVGAVGNFFYLSLLDCSGAFRGADPYFWGS